MIMESAVIRSDVQVEEASSVHVPAPACMVRDLVVVVVGTAMAVHLQSVHSAPGIVALADVAVGVVALLVVVVAVDVENADLLFVRKAETMGMVVGKTDDPEWELVIQVGMSLFVVLLLVALLRLGRMDLTIES